MHLARRWLSILRLQPHRRLLRGAKLAATAADSSARIVPDPNHPLSVYRRLLIIEQHGALDAVLQQQVSQMEEELKLLEAEISRLQSRRHALLEDLVARRTRWEISIRPMNPDDEERQFEFVRRVGNRDHYLRFFSQKHRYSHKEIRELVSVDYHRDFSLVAECCASDQLLGMAQYFGLPDGSVEMAIIVGEAMKGTGLAAVLLDQLCLVCREHGVKTVHASFLAENAPALRLFDSVLARHGQKRAAVEEEGVIEASWILDAEQQSSAGTPVPQ